MNDEPLRQRLKCSGLRIEEHGHSGSYRVFGIPPLFEGELIQTDKRTGEQVYWTLKQIEEYLLQCEWETRLEFFLDEDVKRILES